jgi:lipopolysaccharide/colanic/teichoic acid biosynthesis glycosyltransferase
MVVNADKLGKPLTVGRDPRITRVGYWLRKFKLDELPQLLNVLLGEMSLVGPRPEVPQYVALYTPEQRRVLDLVPGITDPASIKFANEAELLAEANDPEKFYIEHIMPTKIRLNMEYASHATLWSDILVILKTLVRIVR